MNKKTQNIYDNLDFFEGYKKLRENPDNANILEEKPALFSLAPNLTGKAVLDLGCGYGENCAAFLKMGASLVVGVDISEKMLAVARAETSGITYLRADMNDLSAMEGQYDVVFSSLALHYIEDFGKLCRQVADLLNQGGYFIFSQEHPLTTSPINGVSWTRDEQGQRLHYNLTDYARSGRRETTWLACGVIKYHRTFSDIVNGLTNAGFAVEKMLEPVPTAETLARLPNFADEYHKPNFLLIKARYELGVRTIVVIPWQKEWADEFAKIKRELDAVLSDTVISIEHVGSTSVEGLAAKPIIDMDIVIDDSMFEAVKERLASIGYIHNGDQGIPTREAFKYTGKDHLMKHHLYVCPKNSPELHRHLALRDCLRINPDLRDKYSNIKFEMAEKYPHNIDAYIDGKSEVVREIYRVWEEKKGGENRENL
jgi:GrpB-like predicted nucleotidyltransferase (UPF0157 family)